MGILLLLLMPWIRLLTRLVDGPVKTIFVQLPTGQVLQGAFGDAWVERSLGGIRWPGSTLDLMKAYMQQLVVHPMHRWMVILGALVLAAMLTQLHECLALRLGSTESVYFSDSVAMALWLMATKWVIKLSATTSLTSPSAKSCWDVALAETCF